MNLKALARIEKFEVSYGWRGITLIGKPEIHSAQKGYAYLEGDNDLCGEKPGDWRKEWLVIGHTEDCELIFIDTSEEGLPVFTVGNDDGYWEPSLISCTYYGFRRIMMLFQDLSLGRETPMKILEKPLTREQYNWFVSNAKALGQIDDEVSFWEILIADEDAGVIPEHYYAS